MLGTFSALQARRASAAFFHLGASVGKSHCIEAVMGTRWQHVSILKELSKIHVPVPVPAIPSLLTQLIPWGAGFADGGPPCSFSAPCTGQEWDLLSAVGWSHGGLPAAL